MSDVLDIQTLAEGNTMFRRIVHTGKNSQTTVMCLQPNQSIGLEWHSVDQIIFIVEGSGEVTLNGRKKYVYPGQSIHIVAGTEHDVRNISNANPLKLYSVYAGVVHDENLSEKIKNYKIVMIPPLLKNETY